MGNSGLNFFVNAKNVSPGNYASWQNVDVSAYIPAGATGVIVELSDTEEIGKKMGTRHPDSVQDFSTRTEAFLIGGHIYQICGVNSSRVFQAYIEDAYCEVWLVGYTDASVVLFTDMTEYAAGVGTFVDNNVADIVSGDATGIICQFLLKEGAPQYNGVIRKKGSTDDESGKDLIKGPVDALCGLSDSKIFQARVSDADLEIWVKGYTKPPVEFFTNVIKKGPVIQEAVWEEINCLADVGGGVGGLILELVNFNNSAQSTRVVIRRKGSSDNRTDYDDRIRYIGHIWAAVGINEEGKFEAWVKRDLGDQDIALVKFYIHGYVKWDGMLKTKLAMTELEAS